MTEQRTTIGTVLTWAVLGLLAFVALKLALRVLGVLVGVAGMVFGLITFLAFTIGPIVLVGWLAVKAWRAFSRPAPTA